MDDEELNQENREAPVDKTGLGSIIHGAKAYENDEELQELKLAFSHVRKAADGSPEFDPERVLTFIASDETPDRAGDIVRVDGGNVKNFLRNPVFLKQHDHDEACGRVLVFKKINNSETSPEKKAWIAKVYFPVEVEDSEEIFMKFKHGILTAVSISFIATQTNRPTDPAERKKLGLGDWGYEILKWEMLELSAVAVPCNPNALRVKSSQDSSKQLDQIKAMLETLSAGIKSIAESVIKNVPEEVKAKASEGGESETLHSFEKHLQEHPIKFEI